MGEKGMKILHAENSFGKGSEASTWYELHCMQLTLKYFSLDREMYVLILIYTLGSIC